ncbi:hypothetical protein ACQL2C_001523 [Yersinia enterocolitica]
MTNNPTMFANIDGVVVSPTVHGPTPARDSRSVSGLIAIALQ